MVIRLSERDEYLRVLREADQGNSSDLLIFIAEEVAASLDLYLRAARGEEIHEPTDLEKEIALLRIELNHVEEPAPLSREIQSDILKGSLSALYAEIHRLLEPLSELFTQSSIVVSGNIHGRPFRVTGWLPEKRSLSDAVGPYWNEGLFGNLAIEVDLRLAFRARRNFGAGCKLRAEDRPRCQEQV